MTQIVKLFFLGPEFVFVKKETLKTHYFALSEMSQLCSFDQREDESHAQDQPYRVCLLGYLVISVSNLTRFND